MSLSTGQPSALAIFSIACSFTDTGWNSLLPPLLSMNALAALSELHTTTGSGETPGIWTQIGTPSDLYTIANMSQPPVAGEATGTTRADRPGLVLYPMSRGA